MRKTVFYILALVVMTSSSLFANGIRCSSLAGITSLIDSKNVATFPQRALLHPESFCVGSNLNSESMDVYGGVRYHIFDNMAIQFSASKGNSVNLPFSTGSMGDFLTKSLNVFDVSYAYKFDSKMLFGGSVKYFYNGKESNTDQSSSTTSTIGSTITTNSSTSKTDENYSVWYFNLNPSMTYTIDDNTFIDGVLNFGFGSFSGEKKSSTTSQNGAVNSSESIDHYQYGTTEADSWYNIGFETRYYSKDFMKDIDLVPYMGVNYSNYGVVTPDTLENPGYETFTSSQNTDNTLSAFSFKLGSGLHWKVSKNVTVFNEFEFNYSNSTTLQDKNLKYTGINGASVNTSSSNESLENYYSGITVFPTYRLGVESNHEFTEKNWIKNYLFIDGIKLRAGLKKNFSSLYNSIENKASSNQSSGTSTSSINAKNFSESSVNTESLDITAGIAIMMNNWTFDLLAAENDFLNGLDLSAKSDTNVLSNINFVKLQLTYKLK